MGYRLAFVLLIAAMWGLLIFSIAKGEPASPHFACEVHVTDNTVRCSDLGNPLDSEAWVTWSLTPRVFYDLDGADMPMADDRYGCMPIAQNRVSGAFLWVCSLKPTI